MSAEEKPDLWRKAAVLGSLWAASEIVLGSFLHNTRIPLRGHLLTGIGIATLVAGHRLWPQRGLLWRAGLVCAAMKSVSPSAVIFGPMLAISVEGFLLEAGVLLGGANPFGYLLAGGLAMSWALFHKLGGFFMIYGPDTWTIYARSLEKLQAWLGTGAISPWTPILLVWAAHMLGGGLAAVVGLQVGREDAVPTAARADAPLQWVSKPPAEHSHSLPALFLHVLFVAAMMSLGHKLPLWGYAGAAAAYAALCFRYYPRAVSILKKAGIWAGILVVSALAGLLLGRWESGVQMALRVVLLTMGFSCVGTELRNPRIRSWLGSGRGRVFFDALEQAFETLPGVFASLPPGPVLLREPVASLSAAIARAPELLDELMPCRVFIVSGERGAGKSTLVAALVEGLRTAGLSVGGLHAPGLWEEGRRSGFDAVDLLTGQSRPLCRREAPEDWLPLRDFRFSPDGIAFGRRALADARLHGVDVLLIDEAGPFELQGGGWAPELDVLVQERRKPMVWVVRSSLVDAVRKRWGLDDARVFPAGPGKAEELLGELIPARRT
jgi:nucleoside-triphosphatase THEP1